MSAAPHWALLALEPTPDSKAIRRRYAQLLKQIDQQTQPEEFQQLREAYESALHEARWLAQEEAERSVDGTPLEEAAPATEETPPPPSPIDSHLQQWLEAIQTRLASDDPTAADACLSEQLQSLLGQSPESRSRYQQLIVDLCLYGEQIPYAFVTAAADRFGWFDPVLQGQNFALPYLQEIRGRILRHEASLAIGEFKSGDERTALAALQERLQQDHLQGLNERDFFEACLLIESVEQALPLAAMRSLNTALSWNQDNSHLWAIAPDACEAFQERQRQLQEIQDEIDFEAHLYRVAANRPEAEIPPTPVKKMWPYWLAPLLFGTVIAGLSHANGATTGEAAGLFLCCLLISAAIAGWIWFKKYAQHHPRIDVLATQSLISPYRPIWLRWRAFRESHQLRVREWQDYLAERYPAILEKLDPQTQAFWREVQPSISRHNYLMRGILSLPLSVTLLASLASDDAVNAAWMLWLIFAGALGVFLAQIYLFSVLALRIDPAIDRFDSFLANRILPKHARDLPARGLSCLHLLVVTGLLGILPAAMFFGLESDICGSGWFAALLIYPASCYLLGRIYLWNYRRKLNSGGRWFSGMRWWHWYLLLVLAQGLRHLASSS